jgi:thioesterase domain-containing protein
LDVSEAQLSQLDEVAQLQLVVDRAVAAGIHQAAATTGMIAGMAAVYRTNLRAISNYVPPRLNARLTVFSSGDHGGDLGWSALARGPVEVRRAAGDHSSMVRMPHASSLAAAIAAELNNPT